MTSFVKLLISIKLIIGKFVTFMLIIIVLVIFARTTQCNLLHNNFNKIISLMLNTFLIIKSLFFNTEVSLVKNNITVCYSSKKNYLSSSKYVDFSIDFLKNRIKLLVNDESTIDRIDYES